MNNITKDELPVVSTAVTPLNDDDDDDVASPPDDELTGLVDGNDTLKLSSYYFDDDDDADGDFIGKGESMKAPEEYKDENGFIHPHIAKDEDIVNLKSSSYSKLKLSSFAEHIII